MSAGLGAVILAWCAATHAAELIATPREPVVSQYFDQSVTDDYQWLEAAGDPAVKGWTTSQNARSREVLDRAEARPWVERRLRELFATTSANYSSFASAGGRIFFLEFKPPAQQAVLKFVTGTNGPDHAQIVLDPNALDTKGGTSIDWLVPSPNGALIAVSLSEKGSELGTLRFFDTATGKSREDAVPRVNGPTAGGSATWNADGTGVFYTRYPRAGERAAADMSFFQQVYFHRLGTPTEQDTYEIGREFPRIAEIDLTSGPDHRWQLATVANGDGGQYAHWLRAPDGTWRQVTRFEDGIKSAQFGRDPTFIEWPRDAALYVLSRQNAPKGKILRVPLATPTLEMARVVVPETTNAIASFVPSASGTYVAYLEGGPMELVFHDQLEGASWQIAPAEPRRRGAGAVGGRGGRGGRRGGPPGARGAPGRGRGGPAAGERSDRTGTLADSSASTGEAASAPAATNAPPGGGGGFGGFSAGQLTAPLAIQEMLVVRGDELLFRAMSYTQPFRWQRYDPSKDNSRVTATEFVGTSPAPFDDVEVAREFAISKDGTHVPLNIIRRRGLRRDGEAPTILTGYGGYGISSTPRFEFTRRVWLDQGGVIAVANLRGGGEFGEAWHHAGNLANKQNVFDDFIACAEWLIQTNITRPERLAIEGGSNGGLLVGAALTQRPDLFQAAVAHVGLFDMLRVELEPNGAFNVTEFGTVKIREQFDALFAYSPYHRVKDGTDYPATMLLTGEHDGRVNPAQSRKMAARLQAATSGKRPVLLRTSASTGHGHGTPLDARIAQLTDVYSFLLEQLGVFYSLVDRGPWSGAVMPETARVKAKLAHDGLTARLKVSEEESLSGAMTFGPAQSETNHANVVAFELSGLKPNTPYHYALEVNGRLERAKHGELRTFPDGPASFSIAFASCARTGSTNEVFDRIREHRPLFYMNMGDFHYLDINTNARPRYRAGYDAVLASPQQAELYRHVPFVYMWDDHDFGGNNSSRLARSHEAARLTYQEYVPHYPLAAGQGDVPIYHAFNVGRVKFILTDLRSERDSVTNKDDANKSMMGTEQKAWFKKELLAANGKYPLICWMSSVPWLGQKGSNYYRNVGSNQFGYIHHTLLTNRVADAATTATNSASTNRARRGAGAGGQGQDEDHWSQFSTERREIADFIKSNHIRGVCILHGDSHMLAADDGRHGDYATDSGAPMPVMCAGPLDQASSIKGGPYSEGVYKVRNGEGCFGLLTITDKGDTIDVAYSGRNNLDEEKIKLHFSVPASGPRVGDAGHER